MNADMQPDDEPEAVGGTQLVAPMPKGVSGRRSFSNLRRELTDDELVSPAVQRMLLDEIERLDVACSELGGFRDRFYACDKRVGIFEERFKTKISLEIR